MPIQWLDSQVLLTGPGKAIAHKLSEGSVMTVKLGVVMDPIEAINYKKDSTLAMLLEAQKRGWDLYYMEQQDLFLKDGIAQANMSKIRVAENPENWYEKGENLMQPLSALDVILMRKDPPFDNEFLYTTYFLEQAESEGTLIVNRAQSLRDFNEKMFAAQFPQCCPPLLVSRSIEALKQFQQEQQDVIYKPLDGMGGVSIFRVKPGDPNLNVILETLTNNGQRQIMAQKFVPEIVDGDKRILMVDAEPIPYALARIPAQGETRGNLAAGGRGQGIELSERDLWICAQVAPKLKAAGLIFVGLDVIGDYLTEINVTSPTCIRELDTQFSINIASKLMDAIAHKLQQQ